MSLTVLVVEDDQQLQVLAARVLEGSGYRAVIASSGSEARRLAASDPPPDLVLMDIALPDQDGIDLTRVLKATYPDLVIIAVSAHAMAADQERAIEAGCAGFLTKPYQIDQLVQVVRGAIGESASA